MAIEEILRKAVECEVSDLHIVEGERPFGRVHGALLALHRDHISGDQFSILLHALLTEYQRDAFARGSDVDTRHASAEGRWHVHAYTHREYVETS